MRGDLSVDALLARWPAPGRDDGAWDDRAGEILAAAQSAGPAKDDLDALLGAPELEAVPGEPGATGVTGGRTVGGGGVAKMADESKAGEDKGEATSSTGSEAPPSTVAPKRPSLKEIAARASQGGARPSIPGAPSSMRPSPRISSPGLTPAPMPSRPAPKAEAADEDSGIVNLAAAAEPEPEEKAAATSVPPAAKSDPGKQSDQPAATSLPPAAAAPAPKAAATAKAAPAPEAKGGNGAVAGIAIAIVGLAAAFFIVQRGKEPPPPAAVRGPGVETAPTAVVAPAPQAAEAPAATVAAAAPSAAPEASAAPKVALGGPLPSGAAAAGKGAASGVAAASPAAPATGTPAIPPAGTGKPGDLAGAMAQAVGGAQAAKGGDEAKPEPAAGSRNQTIPERPSQGKVQAAVRSALPAAKACVAGAEDVSNANITFGSSGSVTSVSVSGWAASHGQSSCIKSAFSSVNVGPFQQSSYSFSATIRP